MKTPVIVKNGRRKPPDPWAVLRLLIQEWGDCLVAESWKGGGDPNDVPLLEVQLELARLKLERHLERMKTGKE